MAYSLGVRTEDMGSGRQGNTGIVSRKKSRNQLSKTGNTIPKAVKRKTITLSLKDIQDFCFCPKYYDLKRVEGRKPSIYDEYDTTLRQTFNKALNNFEGNTIEFIVNTLKINWADKWIGVYRNTELLLEISNKRSNIKDKLRKTGIDAIMNFTDLLLDHYQVPMVMRYKFKLQIAPYIVLEDFIEYVREVPVDDTTVGGPRKLQLIHICTRSSNFYTNVQGCNDIAMVGQAYAFEKLFNSTPEMVYLDIMKNKMVSSLLTDTKKREFVHTVISVANCIEHNIRCVVSDVKCYHCELRKECMDERRR